MIINKFLTNSPNPRFLGIDTGIDKMKNSFFIIFCPPLIPGKYQQRKLKYCFKTIRMCRAFWCLWCIQHKLAVISAFVRGKYGSFARRIDESCDFLCPLIYVLAQFHVLFVLLTFQGHRLTIPFFYFNQLVIRNRSFTSYQRGTVVRSRISRHFPMSTLSRCSLRVALGNACFSLFLANQKP